MTSLASPPLRRTHAPRAFRSAPTSSKPRKHGALSLDQERELGRRIMAGDLAARDELVVGNLSLARYFARRYVRCTTLELEDLEQAGSEGLVIAASRFDPEAHDVRFGTYAAWWIRSRIQHAIMNTADPIRLPAHIHQAGKAAACRRRIVHVDCSRLDHGEFSDPLEALVELEEQEHFQSLFRRLSSSQRELLRWYIAEYVGSRNTRSEYSLSERRSRAFQARKLLARLQKKLNPLEGSSNV